MTTSEPSSRRPERGAALWRVSAVAACLWVSFGAAAQKPSLTVEPTFAVRQTITDNARLSAADRSSDAVTEISPGVQILSRGGAVRGSLSYSANGIVFARDSERSSVQHSLNANGLVDVVPGRAGVNVSATAGRQAVSAFGTQASSSVLNDANSAEVSTYSLSPYLQGRLLGQVDYVARLTYSGSRTSSASVGDTTTLGGNLGLSGQRGRFGWALDASRTRSEPDQRATTNLSRYGGTLSYVPDIEWKLSLHAGRESNDIRLGIDESSGNWGYGVTWQPGPRTKFELRSDRRFFGRSHGLSFSHRMARSIWTFSDTRDLTTGGSSGGGRVSWYDLFYAQLASLIPDPAERDAAVRAILARDGIDPETQLGGFLTSAPSVVHRQTVGITMQGLRTTVTLSAMRSVNRRLAGTNPSDEDLASVDAIRQYGMTFSLTHRLTPHASLTLAASVQRTLDAGIQPGNDLRNFSATWTSQLGAHSQMSLGLRRAMFDSESNPYHESAVLGSLSMRF